MPILLTGAYRLFFPAAGLFAALAVPAWLLFWTGAAGAVPDPFRWHMHEMLFGYLGAAMAGFLLTAIPNWTGRPALRGWPLLALFLLWLAGRVLFFLATDTAMAAWVAGSFTIAVAAIATREIVLAGNRRNLAVAGLVWLLAAAQAAFLSGFEGAGLRAGFGLSGVAMALIGGRVTPAFSRNWLKARGLPNPVPGFGLPDRAALSLTVFAVLSWIVLADAPLTGWLAAGAALALLVRLLRWRGWHVAREPLLIALHLAYLWLPVAFALLAASALSGRVSEAQVFHALGAGGIGTMTLIVMIRALLGHTNRPLAGGAAEIALLALVHLGAALRVTAPVLGDPLPLYHLSGTLWAAGFLVFALRYTPVALQPRRETSH